MTEAFSFSLSVPVTELKVQTDKKGWHTVSVCSPHSCRTFLHNNNSRTLSYPLNLVSLASLHLTTSVTDLVLVDESGLAIAFPVLSVLAFVKIIAHLC